MIHWAALTGFHLDAWKVILMVVPTATRSDALMVVKWALLKLSDLSKAD